MFYLGKVAASVESSRPKAARNFLRSLSGDTIMVRHANNTGFPQYAKVLQCFDCVLCVYTYVCMCVYEGVGGEGRILGMSFSLIYGNL